MGYLRFILAYLVLLSHVGIFFNGYNQGVFAVTIFYILAGHVVSRLFEEKMYRNNFIFYRDRFLRIFPSYAFIYLLSLIFLVITDFGSPDFNFLKLLLNLLIIPLNYYMYISDFINILRDCSNEWYLIPPAWSLGSELQVYILLPFLLNSRFLFFIGFWSSFFIFSLANLSVLNSDYFGYRFIVGTLFMFLIGVLLQRFISGRYSKLDIFNLVVSYLFLTVWYVYIVNLRGIYGVFTRETVLGLLVGVPLVFIILKFNRRKGRLNIFFGDLSYPLFLSHFLAIWFLQYLFGCVNRLSMWEFGFLVSVIALFISVSAVVFIDEEVKRRRILKEK